jgi:hypothetical protein
MESRRKAWLMELIKIDVPRSDEGPDSLIDDPEPHRYRYRLSINSIATMGPRPFTLTSAPWPTRVPLDEWPEWREKPDMYASNHLARLACRIS